jgi:hypothetical protein
VGRVRSWVEFRLTTDSLRDLAGEIGVGKSSVDNFRYEVGDPEKVWEKMRGWYLRDRRARYASLQDPEDIALLLLETLVGIPYARRAEVLLRTGQHYEEMFRLTDAPRPEWIDKVREMAEREIQRPGSTSSVEYPLPKPRPGKKKGTPPPDDGEK